jgi:hypothetical protein
VAFGVDLADTRFTCTVIEKAVRQAYKIASLGATPEQLTLHHIFDRETADDIAAGRVHLDTQTVTIQRLG